MSNDPFIVYIDWRTWFVGFTVQRDQIGLHFLPLHISIRWSR